jgi:hypothetical protein
LNKEKYPWNYASLLLFTGSCGFFLGVASRGFNSYANFQTIAYLTSVSFFFTVYSTNTWPPGKPLDVNPPPNMMPLPTAGALAWFTTFVIS